MMIADLQRHVAELAQRLAVQEFGNREMEIPIPIPPSTTRITILLHTGNSVVGMKNLLMKSSKKTSSLMRSSYMKMFIMMLNMKMLKILHKDSWIVILHQFMILISWMKILWEILCSIIKRKNL